MKVIRVIDCLIQIIDDDIVPAQVFKRVRCDLRLIQNPTPAFYHLRKKRLVGVGLNLRSEDEMTSTSKKKEHVLPQLVQTKQSRGLALTFPGSCIDKESPKRLRVGLVFRILF